MVADLLYNLKYWTPRAALLITGIIMLILPTGAGAAIRGTSEVAAPAGKRRLLLPGAGVLMLWMSEVWPSGWKRNADGLVGVLMLGAALIGWLSGRRSGNRDTLIATVLGIANVAAAWWPRPWRDYEFGTGWSSGLDGTPEAPRQYSGERGAN